MLELIPNRRYAVAHTTVGLIVGRFVGTDPKGGLKFADVTEFVDVAKGEEYLVSPEGVVDAEEWHQHIELVNYAEVSEAYRVAKSLALRKTVNVERCNGVDVDTE